MWSARKPGDTCHRTLETEAEQACTRQKNERQGNLGDDEAMTQALSTSAGCSAATLRLERVEQLAAES